MAAFDFPDNPVVDQQVTGSRGEVYVWDGEKWTWYPLGGGGGGEPGGPEGAIQFNSDGSFAGSGDLTWDAGENVLEVGGDINLIGDNPQFLINGEPLEFETHPAGSTGMIQYNSFGEFGADTNLFWDVTDARLGIHIVALPEYTLDVGGDVNSTGCYRIGGVEFACGNAGGGIDLTNITNLTATNISVTNINGQPAASLGPAGANTQVQWNNNGVFGASANLWWDDANSKLNVASGAYGVPGLYITEETNSRSGSVFVDQVGFQVIAGANTSLYLYSPDLVEIRAGEDVQFMSGATVGPAFQFSTATSGHALIILPNDYVGIGASPPAYKLDVAGDVNITGCYRILTVAFACGDGAGHINLTNITNINGQPYVPGGGGEQFWQQSPDGTSIYYPHPVAIGTNQPVDWFTIYGPSGPVDAQIQGTNSLVCWHFVSDSSHWVLNTQGSAMGALTGHFSIYDFATGAIPLTITPQDYIGINMLTPWLPLCVNNPAGGGVALFSTPVGACDIELLGTNSVVCIHMVNDSRHWLVTTHGSANDLPGCLIIEDVSVPAYRMIFDIYGNVGVGTAPTSKFTVDGGIVEIRSGNWAMFRPASNGWDFDIFASEASGGGYYLNFASGMNGLNIMRMGTGGGVAINGLPTTAYLTIASAVFAPGSNFSSAYLAQGAFGGGYLLQDGGNWMGMWSFGGNLQLMGGKASLAGQTIGDLWIGTDGNVIVRNGGLAVGNQTASITQGGDVCIARNTSPGTGAIFFGNSGARYIFWDGATWNITGSMNLLGGDFYCNTGNFNGINCGGTVNIAGWLGVGGVAAITDPVTITGMGSMGQLRMAYGSYGFGFHNNGAAFHIMRTNPGDPWGGWINPIPFILDGASGNIGVGGWGPQGAGGASLSAPSIYCRAISVDANGLQVSSTLNTQNGWVGISGVWPTQALDVNGNILSRGAAYISGPMWVDANNTNAGGIDLYFGAIGATNEGIGSMRQGGGNLYGLSFYTSALERMMILNDGRIGMGIWPGSYTLTVSNGIQIAAGCLMFADGTVQCSASAVGRLEFYYNDFNSLIGVRSKVSFSNGVSIIAQMQDQPGYDGVSISFSYISDIRVKRNIRPLAGGLAVINQIRPVEAEYNGLAQTTAGTRFASVIAQELAPIFPLAVYKNPVLTKLDPADSEETDVLCIDPPAVTYQCVLAIQELDSRLSAVEAELRERRN